MRVVRGHMPSMGKCCKAVMNYSTMFSNCALEKKRKQNDK